MADLRTECGVVVAKALNIFIKNKGLEAPEVEAASLLLETPPNPEMGDVGIPLFAFAKTLRMGPPVIASEVAKIIENELKDEASKVGSFPVESVSNSFPESAALQEQFARLIDPSGCLPSVGVTTPPQKSATVLFLASEQNCAL